MAPDPTTLRQLQMTRRSALGLSIGAVAAATLAACSTGTSAGGGGGYTGPTVSLAFWNSLNGPDGAYWKKLVQKFNSEHKNIKVAFDVYDAPDLAQKMPAALQAGQGPELSILNIDSIPTYAARGLIVSLDDAVKAIGLSSSDFSQSFWDGCRYKGKQYAVPGMMPMLTMYYNKSLLEKAGLDGDKPPTTGDEYMEALEKLKGIGIQGHWMSPFYFTGVFQWQSILNQYGGSLVSDDLKTAAFASDEGIKALEWCVDLVTKGYSPANVGQDADYTAFTNQQAAFNWNGSWRITSLQESKLDWGLASLPVIGSKPAVWGDGAGFVVTRKTANDTNKAKAAQTFIAWMSKNVASIAAGGDVPAAKSAVSGSSLDKYPYVKTVASALDTVVNPPAIAGFSDVQALINTAVNKAILGQQSASAALKDAAKQADTILADNAKKYS